MPAVTPIGGGGIRQSTYKYPTQWGHPLGAPVPAAGGGGPVAAGPPTTTTTQLSPEMKAWLDMQKVQANKLANAGPDPFLQEQVQNLRNRMSADTTGRAIDRATGSIADAAAASKAGMSTDLARRGVADTGIGDQQTGRIDAAAARAKAGASADISLGRERDLDRLVLGGSQIMGAPGQYNLAQNEQLTRALGQGIGGAGEMERVGQGWANTAISQQRANQDANQTAMAQWLALMRMYD
jgi:hypothetical protein